jgi:hypothetical protein
VPIHVTNCEYCKVGVLREYEQASPTYWTAKKGGPEIESDDEMQWMACPECGATNFMSADFPESPGHVRSVYGNPSPGDRSGRGR